MIAIGLYGDQGVSSLLIFSQVMLSLQLPFAVYPLVRLTNSGAVMGRFVNRPGTIVVTWSLTGLLVVLNTLLLLLSL